MRRAGLGLQPLWNRHEARIMLLGVMSEVASVEQAEARDEAERQGRVVDLFFFLVGFLRGLA